MTMIIQMHKSLGITILQLLCLCVFSNAYALSNSYHLKSKHKHKHTLNIYKQQNSCPWFVILGLGYGNDQRMFHNDGQNVLERIALGKRIFYLNPVSVDLELGVQTGNTARLAVSQDKLDLMGGLQIDSTFKPTLDLLFGLKVYPISDSNFFIQLKGGAIYRRWQFSRASVNDIAEVNPQFQGGLGFNLTNYTNISLLYQYIYGRNPHFEVNEDASGHVSGIPSQNSILLNFSLYLDKETVH